MLRLTSGQRGFLSRAEDDDWEERSRGPSPVLLLAGLAVVGLGLFSWYYLGPDLKRYLKIHTM